MAGEKILARESYQNLSINTGTDATPVWTQIKGLTSIKPGSDAERTDNQTFDDDGWATHRVASRSRSLEIEGYYIEDPVTGARDPGQAALIDLGDQMGYQSIDDFRVTTLGGNTLEFRASVDVEWGGGGVNDNATFNVKLQIDGQPTFTPAP